MVDRVCLSGVGWAPEMPAGFQSPGAQVSAQSLAPYLGEREEEALNIVQLMGHGYPAFWNSPRVLGEKIGGGMGLTLFPLLKNGDHER